MILEFYGVTKLLKCWNTLYWGAFAFLSIPKSEMSVCTFRRISLCPCVKVWISLYPTSLIWNTSMIFHSFIAESFASFFICFMLSFYYQSSCIYSFGLLLTPAYILLFLTNSPLTPSLSTGKCLYVFSLSFSLLQMETEDCRMNGYNKDEHFPIT